MIEKAKPLLSEFFEVETDRIDELYEEFRPHKGYLKKILSKDKSLSMLECFVLFVTCRLLNIKRVSELGVRYGISSRFWMKVANCSVVGYDIKKLYNKRLSPIEGNFEFVLGDANKTFTAKGTDLVFYDAHPYRLTRKIADTSRKLVDVHCFHDVGSLCFQRSSRSIPKSKRGDYNEGHGHWERHVMAEVFNRSITNRDLVVGDIWRSLIVDDKYGIGVTVKNTLIGG